jgi:molybdenum cofactor cytidylyltransferase
MPRFFAIIPAAGRSTRMGAPKLLLPVGNERLIERTLAAWKSGGVDWIVVVVRPDDAPLATLCRSCGAEVVIPLIPPPEMKASVQHGLQHITTAFNPGEEDAWLLAPADMPGLSPLIIQALRSAHDPRNPAILVPTIGGRRGHPVLFPWPLVHCVRSLGSDEGINALCQSQSCREVPCDSCEPAGPAAFADLDTPQDYDEFTK